MCRLLDMHQLGSIPINMPNVNLLPSMMGKEMPCPDDNDNINGNNNDAV